MKLVNINKSFLDNNIFSNLNYEFKKNKTYIIKGKSGSGKTVLLNILKNKYKFDSGKYLNKPFQSDVFYLTQNGVYFEELTFYENLNKILSNQYNKDNIKELIIRFKVSHLLEKYVYELSSGEKKILSFIMCLLSNRNVFLLDEPTASVDNYRKKIIWEEIDKLGKNKTVIITTHDEIYLKNYTELHIEENNIYEINNFVDKKTNIINSIEEKNKENIININMLNKRFFIGKFNLLFFLLIIISYLLVISSLSFYNVKVEGNIDISKNYYQVEIDFRNLQLEKSKKDQLLLEILNNELLISSATYINNFNFEFRGVNEHGLNQPIKFSSVAISQNLIKEEDLIYGNLNEKENTIIIEKSYYLNNKQLFKAIGVNKLEDLIGLKVLSNNFNIPININISNEANIYTIVGVVDTKINVVYLNDSSKVTSYNGIYSLENLNNYLNITKFENTSQKGIGIYVQEDYFYENNLIENDRITIDNENDYYIEGVYNIKDEYQESDTNFPFLTTTLNIRDSNIKQLINRNFFNYSKFKEVFYSEFDEEYLSNEIKTIMEKNGLTVEEYGAVKIDELYKLEVEMLENEVRLDMLFLIIILLIITICLLIILIYQKYSNDKRFFFVYFHYNIKRYKLYIDYLKINLEIPLIFLFLILSPYILRKINTYEYFNFKFKYTFFFSVIYIILFCSYIRLLSIITKRKI